MTTHQLKQQPCPRCRAPLDRATNAVGRGAPKPGDVTVCAGCAVALQFDDSLQLKVAVLAELEPDVLRSVQHAQLFIRRLKR